MKPHFKLKSLYVLKLEWKMEFQNKFDLECGIELIAFSLKDILFKNRWISKTTDI